MGVHYELSEEEKFYRNALTRMPDGPAALEEAYNAVEDIVNEVEQYVKVRVTFLQQQKVFIKPFSAGRITLFGDQKLSAKFM